MYTPEQLEMMKEVMREYLYFFNYTDHPHEQADPNTTFFTYDGVTKHDEGHLEQFFNGYKRINADGLSRLTSGLRIPGDFTFNVDHPVDIGMK